MTADEGADRVSAGKTGTSQDYGNAWFVGYTPTLSTSIWLGYKDRPRPLLNIKGVGRVAGGTIPAATWGDYMEKAMKGVPPSAFDEPAPIKRVVRPNPVVVQQRKQRKVGRKISWSRPILSAAMRRRGRPKRGRPLYDLWKVMISPSGRGGHSWVETFGRMTRLA